MNNLRYFFRNSFLVLIILNHFAFAQWLKTNNSPNSTIYCLETYGSLIFAGTQAGIYYSGDYGNNWIFSGLVNIPVYSMASSGIYIYAGTNDGIRFSTDTGASWTVINNHNNGLSYPEIRALLVRGSNLYAGANGGTKLGGVFISANNSASWSSLSNGISDKNIQVMTANATNIFIGSTNDGVYTTANDGALWTFSGIPNTLITCLKPIGSNIFAGSLNGVYYSPNNGVSWELRNSGLTMLTINAMMNSGNNIFVGTAGTGVFLSTDNGSSWVSANTGLTEANIKCFLVVGNNIYMATSSGNIWWRPLYQMITDVKEYNGSLPSKFILNANYPNPFNPETVISYQLPVSGHVNLKIYDILGREIATLVNEEKGQGFHEVKFNGNKLTSGVYFYQLKAGEFLQTKKMILLK